MSNESAVAKGLEGVVVAETQKSKVDGAIGKLQYHGYNIFDLAEHATFEEVIYLLWYNKLPNKAELEAFKVELNAQRTLDDEIITRIKGFPKTAHPMAVLRSVISVLGAFDPEEADTSPASIMKKSIRLTGVMPTIIAAWERVRSGVEPIAPRADLSLAANFLYMLKGVEPGATEVRALDVYLILLADHGMNASTFSARVTTATLSDLYSAITTAIGTLKGPAHGGANEKAMEQFISVDSPDKVEAWFKDAMTAGKRLMGIGHRVYKVEDPRATILRKWAKELAVDGEVARWYEIAYRLEQQARTHEYFIERNLFANVDYYSAIVLYQVGIPVDQFTPLFAMSRIAGWTAHVMEQWQDNRLIRPRAQYVGPENVAWEPLEKRS
jgi:citrate synthase